MWEFRVWAVVFRVQVSGFGVQGSGSMILGLGIWVLGSGIWVLGSGFWVLGFGFWVLGFGSRVSGFGFRVLGLGFRVWGLGFGPRREWGWTSQHLKLPSRGKNGRNRFANRFRSSSTNVDDLEFWVQVHDLASSLSSKFTSLWSTGTETSSEIGFEPVSEFRDQS